MSEKLRVVLGESESLHTAAGEMRPIVWGEHGMTAWVRVRAAAGLKVLRCVVPEARGDALWCESAAYDIAQWVPIGQCFLPADDPHTRVARVTLEAS